MVLKNEREQEMESTEADSILRCLGILQNYEDWLVRHLIWEARKGKGDTPSPPLFHIYTLTQNEAFRFPPPLKAAWLCGLQLGFYPPNS